MTKTLWAKRTIYNTLIQVTPHSLASRVKAVLLLEHLISSLRFVIQEGVIEEENV